MCSYGPEYHDSNRYLARIRLSISTFILILVIPELACSDLAANMCMQLPHIQILYSCEPERKICRHIDICKCGQHNRTLFQCPQCPKKYKTKKGMKKHHLQVHNNSLTKGRQFGCIFGCKELFLHVKQMVHHCKEKKNMIII